MTTTITTYEALTALPDGTRFTVSSGEADNQWIAREGGLMEFAETGTRVNMSVWNPLPAGAPAEAAPAETTPTETTPTMGARGFHVGAVYGTALPHVLLERAETGVWTTLPLRGHLRFRQFDEGTLRAWGARVGEEPRLAEVALLALQNQRSTERLDEIQAGLHLYLDENDYSPESTLDRLMEEWGMGRPSNEDVVAQVRITGSTRITTAPFPGARVLTGGDVTWETTVPITVSAPAGTCLCENTDLVGYDRAQAALAERGVTGMVSWEVTRCDNDDPF